MSEEYKYMIDHLDGLTSEELEGLQMRIRDLLSDRTDEDDHLLTDWQKLELARRLKNAEAHPERIVSHAEFKQKMAEEFGIDA